MYKHIHYRLEVKVLVKFEAVETLEMTDTLLLFTILAYS